MNIIDHLKKVIRGSGRKYYTFVMGKLNVAKMANFMEVDCYVLVACPENSLIDSKVRGIYIFIKGRGVIEGVACAHNKFDLCAGVLPPNCYPIRARTCTRQVHASSTFGSPMS